MTAGKSYKFAVTLNKTDYVSSITFQEKKRKKSHVEDNMLFGEYESHIMYSAPIVNKVTKKGM